MIKPWRYATVFSSTLPLLVSLAIIDSSIGDKDWCLGPASANQLQLDHDHLRSEVCVRMCERREKKS